MINIIMFIFTFSLYAQTELVNSGQVISAPKINEIIAKLNYIEENLPPIGSVIAIPGNCPNDYMLANGESLNRAEYNMLFSVIGTSHGTSDLNSFNIPDYRGYFMRGTDNGAGVDPNANSRTAMRIGGNTFGIGSTQQSEIKEHSHSIQRRGNSASNHYDLGDGRRNENSAMTTDRAALTNFNIGNSGASESRPVNVSINYCIKYQ